MSPLDKDVGRFTCHTHRGQSVVDYVLVSQDLINNIECFMVDEPNILSDHSVLSFSIPLTCDLPSDSTPDTGCYRTADYKYVWDNAKSHDFSFNLNSPDCISVFDQIRTALSDDNVSNTTIDENLNLFVNTIETCAQPYLKKRCSSDSMNMKNHNRSTSNAMWFTDDCMEKKGVFYECLDTFRNDRTDNNRINFVNARSCYKKSLRRARYEYDTHQTSMLNGLRYKNAKEYWKLLRSVSSPDQPKIELSKFTSYFKAVNNHEEHIFSSENDNFLFDNVLNSEAQIMFNELDVPISIDDILQIKQLSAGKSSGPDKMINEILIHGSTILSPY